jgi:hypothetical protein
MTSIHRPEHVTDYFHPPLRVAWQSSRARLSDLAKLLNVPTEDAFPALFINMRMTDSPDERPRTEATATEEQVNVVTRTIADGKTNRVIAWPTKPIAAKQFHLAPFIEIHSRLLAWWLTTVWRSLDLAQSTWELADSDRVTSAAACSRALLETSAAFWCKAKELDTRWKEIKVRGITAASGFQDWHDLNMWIWKTTYGAKFGEQVLELKQSWAHLESTNVLGHIEKLAKSLPNLDLQTHYQWLCNTVHPSCGGTIAMSTPLDYHASERFAFVWFAPFPLYIQSSSGRTAQRTIQEAIATSAIVAVRVMLQTLDESLRIIDDIGLTTGAPKMATFNYWRQLQVTTKKQLCPCRSGFTYEKCHHRWRESSPSIGSSFTWQEL